jgi:uncharacterized membrane protein YoaK (UPF0700 family)
MATPPTEFLTGKSFPLMERPLIALLLALLAGMLSGYTYFIAGLFASVQSGNVIQMGFWLVGRDGDADWVKVGHAAAAVLAYGLGAMVTIVIERMMGRIGLDYSWPILLVEAVILIGLGTTVISDRFELWQLCAVVSLVAGMQGNAFHRLSGMLYGNVAVTLVVQMAFSYFMSGVLSRSKDTLRASGAYFLVLVGFAGGGLAGALITMEFNHRTLWVAAALAIVLAIFGMVDQKEHVPVDPA